MGRLIAVTSAKGSPGCTFVAVGLARCLAAGGLRTLLLDADAEEPGVGEALCLPVFERPTLAALVDSDPGALIARALPAGDRLSVVEVPPDPQGALGRRLPAALRASADAVVADLGHHPAEIQAQLAVASDWLLWVVAPGRVGIQRFARALASGRLVGSSVGIVLNKLERGGEAGLEAIPRLPVMARLPRHDRSARNLRPAHRGGPFGRPLRELARSVHPGAPEAPPAWP